MLTRNHYILTIIFIIAFIHARAGQIWTEKFTIPGKGIWGDSTGTVIHCDFYGITTWSLEYSGVKLGSSGDYAQTVSTSGGRFEVCDIDGFVIWRSEWIKTNGCKNVAIQLSASETGSGANETNKYLNATFRINNGEETLFQTNGMNAGNWGSAVVSQTGLRGDSLQIVVRMANSYSSDKVILDEIIVAGEGNIWDSIPPEITNIDVTSRSTVEVEFNEPMKLTELVKPQNYSVSDNIGQPDSIIVISALKVKLIFLKTFTEDKTYTLNLSGITDESGNMLARSSVGFIWFVGHPGDLFINEILPNSYPEGADFIELYNVSGKSLYLDQLWLSNGKDTFRLLTTGNKKFVLLPEKYVACTKDSAKAALPYPFSCRENIVGIKKFPTIYNDEGLVEILNDDFEVIDRVLYSKESFSPFLSSIAGVSLERISPVSPSNDPSNWQPAAQNAGFATPGCENSQASKNQVASVSFEPESFSPNNDGYNDEYRIKYQLQNAGYIGNAWIYDAAGRLVLQLARNEILGTEGSINWDGKDKTGGKIPVGVYVVVFEIFDLRGNIRRYKDAVVLTGIFE